MKIPGRVRIVGKTYRVVAHDDFDDDRYGDCNVRECLIRLDLVDVDPQQVRDTLLHEILHALWKESGLGAGEGASEEVIVRQLATSLLATLRENPPLVRFLLSKEDS